MIADLLNEARERGAIQGWQMQRRLMFPDQYLVTENNGEVIRWSKQGIIDFCVGLAIGFGEIPDPAIH